MFESHYLCARGGNNDHYNLAPRVFCTNWSLKFQVKWVIFVYPFGMLCEIQLIRLFVHADVFEHKNNDAVDCISAGNKKIRNIIGGKHY